MMNEQTTNLGSQTPEPQRDEARKSTSAPNQHPLYIPAAIVITGLVIAGAIFATRVEAPQPQEEGGLSEEVYIELAEDLDIDSEAFATCREEQEIRDLIQSDLASAQAAGGQGTPYTVVIDAQGNAQSVSGAVPYETLASLVDQAITGFDASDTAAAQALPVGADEHIRGDVNAPVTIVEYSDLECPFCARIHPSLVRALDEYDGQVRWVYRHFPLTNIHPQALPAAIASECVSRLAGNDAFWQFVDGVFAAH